MGGLAEVLSQNALSRPQIHHDFRRKSAIEVVRLLVGTVDINEKRFEVI